MGRREELEAELELLGVEEAWIAAKEARRANDTTKTRAAYDAARDALTAARAARRDARTSAPSGPGGATVKPKTVSAKASAQGS
jgi:hypothetical protein